MHLRMGCCLLSFFLSAFQPDSGSAEPVRRAAMSSNTFGATLNEGDLGPYRLKGRASITGQAFLVTHLNKVFIQPGGVVVLLPVTRQTREWFERVVQHGACPSGQEAGGQPGKSAVSILACGREAVITLLNDKSLAAYIRITRTNPSGHFWFSKLPAGRYFVISPITGGNDHGREPKGTGVAWTRVEVEWGERVTNVVVTDQSRD